MNADVFLVVSFLHPEVRKAMTGNTCALTGYGVSFTLLVSVTGSYTVGEPVFFRSFGLFHLQVQKEMETII